MKTYQLQSDLWLSQPLVRVFSFFADPHNLQRITPPWLRFEILTRRETTLEKGTLLDYRLRLRGIPFKWQSEIIAWEPPYRFVDHQTQGPYSLWVHEHTFTETRGGTTVGDYVEYAAPGGGLVRKWLVAPDLEKIFRYRRQILSEIFNSHRRTIAM